MQLTFNHSHNHHLLHDVLSREQGDGWVSVRVYGVRAEALIVATGLWVMLTLTTGELAVAMVLLIGAAVGNAHHLLKNRPCAHRATGAALMVLVGGAIANLLAGLALYSSRMGVGYLDVLLSRRLPEDMPLLFALFGESYRSVDGLLYVLAAVVAALSARHLEPWSKKTGKSIN